MIFGIRRLFPLALALLLGLASALRAEPVFVPEKDQAKLNLPYRITFVNRYEKTPELPPLFANMVEKEIRAFLKLGLGPLVDVESDDRLNQQLVALLDSKDIEQLTPDDLPPTSAFDRIILGDLRKNANLFELRLREAAPQDARLSPVIRIVTIHPQKIGRLYASAATENFSLGGYITEVAPPPKAGRPAEIKVALRASRLLPADLTAPNARVIFRITEVFTDFFGKDLERRLLPWWYVEMESGRFHLVGQDFKPHPDTDEYRVSYRLHRIQLQGGKQTIRLVSQKDPDRRLASYSVYASYAPGIDRYRDLIGLTNDNGEIEVVDKERLPVYLRVEKDGFVMRELMMLVQPQAGPFEIPLPEYHPILHELVRRAEDLGNRMMELQSRLNGAQTKAAEMVADPAAREAQFAEAEMARAALVDIAQDIKNLERDAAGAGADLDAHLADLKKEYARRTANLPDLRALRAKLNEAAATISGASRFRQLDDEAARLWAELKWEEAQAKYEEALRVAPEEQKGRIEQKLTVVKPLDESHAAARRFVRDELSLLDERAACERAAEIESHVKRLMNAHDTPFVDAGIQKINDLNGRIVAAAGKLLKEAEQDPQSAKDKAAAARSMVEASKRLDTLITRATAGSKGAPPPTAPAVAPPAAEKAAAPPKAEEASLEKARQFFRDEIGALDERTACDRVAEIQKHLQRLADAGDAGALADARGKLSDLNSRLGVAAGRLLNEAEKDPATAKEKAGAAQRMIDTSKVLDNLMEKPASGKAGGTH